MPIYEFICANCHKISEVILLASEKAPKACPSCGGKLRKRVSSPAIRFKGSGWYVTDYAKHPSSDTPGKKEPQKSNDAKESKDTKESKGTATAPAAPTPASDTPSKDSSPAVSKKES